MGKLRNRGNDLYTKVFTSRDGNCNRETDRVSTQVWEYDGSLSLSFPSEEVGTEEPERITTPRRELFTEPQPTDTLFDDDEFTCSERCIPSTWRCDGDRDCRGGEDEADCESPETSKLKAGCEGNTCTAVTARGDVVLR